MEYEKEGCLHEMFVRQAKKTPNATAVVMDDGRSLSFSELDQHTDILATNLRLKGCRRGSVVGIHLERNLEYPVAYIAILKAGGAYMPLELSYPDSLLQSVLDDAEPVAVVTRCHWKEKFCSVGNVIVLNEGWKERLQEENESKPPLDEMKTSLDDLAYVVYSSGTTGKPKGNTRSH